MADISGVQIMDEKDSILIGALKGCKSRETLEKTFDLYQIADKTERIDKLNNCMGNPETFFSSDNLSVEETYELTIQMFLSMSWKLNELYERMGIGV